MGNDNMYREFMLDHYHNPHNKGTIKNADIHKYDVNISCGDEIDMYIKVDKTDNTITKVQFEGRGCVICIATASILTDEIQGKKLSEIQTLKTEDMLKLIGIQLTPARIKCAMLPLVTIQKGIIEYETKK